MNPRTFLHSRTNLINVFAIILLCLGYFNFFFVVETVSIFLRISSLTGQILVNKFLSLVNGVVEIVNLTYSFLQVVHEDSLIFFKDATEKLDFSLCLLKELYLFLEEFVWIFFDTALQALERIFYLLEFLHFTIWKLKEGIQLTGSTIWRLFTHIPEVVILKISEVNEFLKNTVIEVIACIYTLQENIIESLVKTYKFLFYVPFDSVCGLIVGGVLLIILCVKFKDICYVVSSAFLKLYQQTTSLGISLWSGRVLEQKTRRDVDCCPEDERLCVVCQNQLKEIITFPCKHLCLCEDCTNKLTKNQSVCPICRSNITGTLKVYI